MGPYELLEKLVTVFEGLGIPYIVTGSVAAMAYGEPRLTNDIDIVAGIERDHVQKLVAAFPAEEFYISRDMILDALSRRSQFNIIHPSSGLKADIIIRKDTPFDRSRFGRARRIQPSATYEASFAAPEDVIIKKLEYYKEGGSEKHLRDITGILKVSAGAIDLPYIYQWAGRLGVTEIWERIQERISKSRC